MEWSTTQILDVWYSSHREDACLRIVKRFSPAIVKFGCDLGLRREDAEDVAQETMLELNMALKTRRYQRPKGRLRDYIYGIARNTITEHLKRLYAKDNRAGSRKDTEFWESVPDKKATRHTWNTDVQKMIMEWCLEKARREFGPDRFRIFELHGVKRMTAEEVGAELGMSAGAVRVTKHRIAARIRELLALLDKQI